MKPAVRSLSWVARLCALAGCAATVVLPDSIQAAGGAASDYLINVWNSEDGLPQSSVNCLAQTPDGYIWIGTRSGGLARFDGSRFVVFNPQSTPELQDVEMETLSVDSRGTLWITAGNESAASLTGGKFHLVRERNAQPRWHPLNLVAEESNAVYLASFHPTIFRVPRNGAANQADPMDLRPSPLAPAPATYVQADDGAVWYVTEDRGVARWPLPSQPPTQPAMFHLPSPARLLAKDDAGTLWVAADRDFGVMQPNGFSAYAPTNGPAPTDVRQMIASRDGGLWIWDGLQLRKMRRGQWAQSSPQFRPNPSSQSLRFYADSQGGLWVSEYGVGLWNIRADGAATLLTRRDGLPSKFVTCWLEDNEGNIWIGTKEAGLARVRRRPFREYTAADGIPGDVAQTVCEDAQGTIWVGTANGGLARKEGDVFIPVPLSQNPDPLIESVTVCPDATTGIWIGALQGSVFRGINNVVRSVNNDVSWSFPMERLRDHLANAMMQDTQGRVWFCNGSGANYFQAGKLNAFSEDRGFVANIGVRALAEGPPGVLWFGTEPGDLWEVIKDKPIRHHPPAEWPLARVSALLPDADGGIWVGTLGGGLLRFDHGVFTRVTAKEGLPDNSITQLLEDNEGDLWGGTYAGIFRAAKKDLKRLAAKETNEIAFSIFGHFDGLPAQGYSGWFQPSCWRSRDGRLWFTTVKGLVAVNPSDVKINRRPPAVVIEDMRVDGAPCEFKSGRNSPGLAAAAPLSLGTGRHYVEFRFTGINFTAPDKVRLKWCLEGAEKQWREAINQRTASYGPLMPGDYRFRVLAANSDGIWNESGASLEFVVPPFFYETWWFKTLLIAAVCGALALGVTLALRRRHRLELERVERGHEMERERTRIARDMHDEIGSKLARISYLSEVARGEAQHPEQVDAAVDSLSKTAQDLMQSLDRMVWAVNPRNDSLDELAAYLHRYAAEYFQNTPIRPRLTFPKGLPAVQLSAETRHNVFLAFEEALANVLKHSGATQVAVELIQTNGSLEIRISDNGNGFGVETQLATAGGWGVDDQLGLSGMSHRLRSIGGRCQISSARGGGTEIRFLLPLSRTHGS